MGNVESKFSQSANELSQYSVRMPEKINERWEQIFRYIYGGIGGTSAIGAWLLLLKWINDKKIGGLSRRSEKGILTKGYMNWHVIAMSTGFLLFMAPSLLTFEVIPLSRSGNKSIHQWANNIAMLASAIGWLIIYDCNNYLSKGGSARSVHGIMGYVTLGLLLANWIGGFLMYVLGYGGALRGSLKPLHKRMGMVTLLIGLANICVGLMQLQSKYRLSPEMTRKTHLITFLVLLSFIGMFGAITKYYDKSDLPDESH